MIKLSSKFGLISSHRAIGIVDIMTNSNHTRNAWIKRTAHVLSMLNAKPWDFPFHSFFLSGFLWTRREPCNYPYWILLTSTTFWAAISIMLTLSLLFWSWCYMYREYTSHIWVSTHACTLQTQLLQAAKSQLFLSWHAGAVVYMLQNSFHITYYNLRHLQFELSHLTNEDCIVHAFN